LYLTIAKKCSQTPKLISNVEADSFLEIQRILEFLYFSTIL
jgi:hypothetical protein